MNLEYLTLCPVCNGNSFQDFIKARDYTTTQEEFQIQRCSTCNFLFTNPRPDADSIGKYYSSENYISHSGKSNVFGNIYRLARNYTLRTKYNLISELKPTKGKILDYGCGTGEFLNFFKQRNWEAIGLEPNKLAREKASTLLHQTVSANISDINETNFDIITLWHVLEHVHNLNETLDVLKSKLHKEGFMFIAVPNPNSADCTKYKCDWAAYDVPRHLWHFSRETMSTLLRKHGLKIADTKPMKLDAYYVALLSEGYKHSKRNKLINALMAIDAGLQSNSKAAKTGEYSSLIYIVKSE